MDESRTILVRRDGTWFIEGGRRAEESSVERTLEAVAQMESTKLLTRKPSRFAELQVDEETGVQVSVGSTGRELARFVIGTGGDRDHRACG